MQVIQPEKTSKPGSIFDQADQHTLIPHVAYASEHDSENPTEVTATVLYKGCVIMFSGFVEDLECAHAFHADKRPIRPTAIELCAAFVRLHYRGDK